MTTDWKALCAELLAWAEKTSSHYYIQPDVLLRARAALAEPVREGPPAVTTGAWLHPAYEPGDGSADGAQMVELAWWHPQFGCDSLQMVVDNARAILARWGNPAPQPPAKGEVDCISIDEMCEILRSLEIKPTEYTDCAVLYEVSLDQLRVICDTRAALARWGNPAPQPVPVSERLPRPADCDVKGRCWMLVKVGRGWRLINPEKSGLPHLKYCFSHWLPFHALPLPEQEVSE